MGWIAPLYCIWTWLDVMTPKYMNATKHFVNTGYPVIVALPDKAWKWCYNEKLDG